jgi:hypothetical protein
VLKHLLKIVLLAAVAAPGIPAIATGAYSLVAMFDGRPAPLPELSAGLLVVLGLAWIATLCCSLGKAGFAGNVLAGLAFALLTCTMAGEGIHWLLHLYAKSNNLQTALGLDEKLAGWRLTSLQHNWAMGCAAIGFVLAVLAGNCRSNVDKAAANNQPKPEPKPVPKPAKTT